MNENAEAAADKNGEDHSDPVWTQATLEDVRDLDFENPIAEADTVDCDEMGDLFGKTAKLHEELGDDAAAPAARVFAMLAAITWMHVRPEEPHQPYDAMVRWGDGRRSAIPEDFRGEPVDVLAHMANRAKNPVLRARLADICWLLERKRIEMARAAIAAYVEIIEKLEAGELKNRSDDEVGSLGLSGRDILRRALQIAQLAKLDSDDLATARSWVVKLRDKAFAMPHLIAVGWFAELDLDFGISDAGEIAKQLEQLLIGDMREDSPPPDIDIWRLAARAYHAAKDEAGEYRCRAAGADHLATAAEMALEKQGSAMNAAHWLSAAIAEYHGVPGKRDRRTELRHKLIDIQARVPDEMGTFSQAIDLREIVKSVEERMEGLELVDLLLHFADLERSPDPEKLAEDAIKTIKKHPLASLFGGSFHDSEGKVIHRTEGGGFGHDDNQDAILVEISRHEQIRRQIHSAGQIDTARRIIMDRHHVGDDTFVALLRHSPFVPNDLIHTFARGFTRFFQGDMVSALYVLTPLLENSLRHVLKLNGHDVTTFDDARQTQEDRSITSLYEQMRPELDEVFGKNITTDIENVFISKPGPSLRHAVAHGLLHDGSVYGTDALYACWLIFRLCCIPLFSEKDEVKLPS